MQSRINEIQRTYNIMMIGVLRNTFKAYDNNLPFLIPTQLLFLLQSKILRGVATLLVYLGVISTKSDWAFSIEKSKSCFLCV